MHAIILRLKASWTAVQAYVQKHEKLFHRTHNVTHLSYFTMVATHGPYHYAALALLILGIISWALHLGEVE